MSDDRVAQPLVWQPGQPDIIETVVFAPRDLIEDFAV
jgi:hypothetical protein